MRYPGHRRVVGAFFSALAILGLGGIPGDIQGWRDAVDAVKPHAQRLLPVLSTVLKHEGWVRLGLVVLGAYLLLPDQTLGRLRLKSMLRVRDPGGHHGPPSNVPDGKENQTSYVAQTFNPTFSIRGWASDWANDMIHTYRKLREVVESIDSVDRPIESRLFAEMEAARDELNAVVSNEGPDARILKKIVTYYRVYHAYVLEVHRLIRDRGLGDRIEADRNYLGWERFDSSAASRLFDMVAGQPGLAATRDALNAIGRTDNLHLS